MPAPPLAAAANNPLVDTLLEFLEAFIHQVLFVRELYSPELFERQRLYGIAVRRARHPELAAYIADAVGGLRVSLTALLMPTRSDSRGSRVPSTALYGSAWHMSWLCGQPVLGIADGVMCTVCRQPCCPSCLQGPLVSGSLAKVAIVVLDPQRQPEERFLVEPQVGPLPARP